MLLIFVEICYLSDLALILNFPASSFIAKAHTLESANINSPLYAFFLLFVLFISTKSSSM